MSDTVLSVEDLADQPGGSGSAEAEVASLGGSRFWGRFRRNRLALAAGGFLVLL
ncbi:MAG TPA: ABC transporter, partial [Acidimicrobiaceae bacterium]|nr:ABC transporter [Acidimicrobiaceae bacterium]